MKDIFCKRCSFRELSDVRRIEGVLAVFVAPDARREAADLGALGVHPIAERLDDLGPQK